MMNKEMLRKVQLCELEILIDVKKVCEDYGISYFLSGGTLLGAIRHGGFIPWDDDIDIGMLRSDFERFDAIAQRALGEKYFYQTWSTDPEFPFASAKVRKKGTLYQEATSMRTHYHNEVFVDIFPYDNYPECSGQQKKQGRMIDKYRKTFMMKSGMTPWRMKKGIIKKTGLLVKNIPYIIQGYLCNKEKTIVKYIRTMTMFNDITTSRVFEECNGTNYGKFVVPRECIGVPSPVLFEGVSFLGPEDPDGYLSAIYGDYMKLPPENKRVNHSVVDVKI